MNKESIQWLLSFMALAAGFYFIDQSQWFHEIVSGRLAVWNTTATVSVLSLLGASLEQAGSTIITDSGSLEIAESCTGTFVFMMFAAAVLPFPSTWQWRLKGLFLGLAALLTLNLFRTSMIVLVGSRFPGAIDAFHLIIGQIVVIAGMTTVMLWWAKNSQQGAGISFLKNNRQLVRAVALFCVGYIIGFQLYRIFLESSLGLFVKQAVEAHTVWLLSALTRLFSNDHLAQFSAAPVNLIDGCLSSPMVVVFVAFVFAWPARWWKRALIILLCFIPFFYGYHLLRACLIAVTLGLQSKGVNVAYNFYGQIVLAVALFAGTAYLWCTQLRLTTYKRFLCLFLASGVIGIILASGLGWVTRHFLIPFLTLRISGTQVLSCDPQQTISFMMDLQVFIWLCLVGPTPGMPLTRKTLFTVSGILAAFAMLILAILLIEVFHLCPPAGMLKFGVVLVPFAAYYFSCLYPRQQTGGDPDNA